MAVLEASWRPSWPSWKPSWTSWRPLEPSWGPLGAVLGASWAVMGPSWRPLGRSWGDLGGLLGRRKAEKAQMPKSFKRHRKINDVGLFGPFWRTSWRPLEPSWGPLGAVLGASWAVMGHLGGLLGDRGATLGASWAVLGRRKAEKKQMPKSFKHLRNSNDFGPFRPFQEDLLEASWAVLETSSRPRGPSEKNANAKILQKPEENR